ncbi:hypothetical protein FOXB_17140 [Fusarium oxysporum f. sp. conglutinans Fo5176]|uniref:Uncharacterized protein n=2 Tax=Fusarium oxysporum f. sp. conglutinans TaxID=100902 RepID=F9GEQ6_FUSOF|nr:hypothetical protein FOXB_17140 [Fusarium oxysporum f. sp. conglutinans Fo5176]
MTQNTLVRRCSPLLCIAAMQNDSVNISHIYNLYQVEEHAWATIQILLANGASACTKFGSKGLSYEEIAQEKEKKYLARKFKELGPCPSPTILNSSREPSCIPGECNDVQLDNEQLRDDPEVDGGARLSRESSCTVGRDDDIQPNNKRPREDPEVDGGAKRARGA